MIVRGAHGGGHTARRACTQSLSAAKTAAHIRDAPPAAPISGCRAVRGQLQNADKDVVGAAETDGRAGQGFAGGAEWWRASTRGAAGGWGGMTACDVGARPGATMSRWRVCWSARQNLASAAVVVSSGATPVATTDRPPRTRPSAVPRTRRGRPRPPYGSRLWARCDARRAVARPRTGKLSTRRVAVAVVRVGGAAETTPNFMYRVSGYPAGQRAHTAVPAGAEVRAVWAPRAGPAHCQRNRLGTRPQPPASHPPPRPTRD